MNNQKKVPTAIELQEQIVQNKTIQEIYEEWVVIRKQDVKPASFVAEQISLKGFIEKFSKYKVSEVTTADIQSYLMELDIANSTRKKIVEFTLEFCSNMLKTSGILIQIQLTK